MTTIAETPRSDGEPAGSNVMARQEVQRNPRAWIALASFAGLALLMYVSIMLKIVKYGP